MRTSNGQRLFRSRSCENRPFFARRQKLSKALRATSSSSTARRGMCLSFLRTRATRRRKYRSQSFCAASGSPVFRALIQAVTDPSSSTDASPANGVERGRIPDHRFEEGSPLYPASDALPKGVRIRNEPLPLQKSSQVFRQCLCAAVASAIVVLRAEDRKRNDKTLLRHSEGNCPLISQQRV